MAKSKNSISASEILYEQRKRRQIENQEHIMGLKKTIDVNNFFITAQNPIGFMKADSFIDDIGRLSKYDETDFEVFFQAISNNEKLEKRSPRVFEVRDTGFNAFEVEFGPYNFREKFRIILIDGMVSLIKAIKTNAFIFKLDFDSLIEKANEIRTSNERD